VNLNNYILFQGSNFKLMLAQVACLLLAVFHNWLTKQNKLFAQVHITYSSRSHRL